MDFFLKVDDPDTFEVLYRNGGRSSYKRSEVKVRQTEMKVALPLPVVSPSGTARIRSGDNISVLLVSGMIQAVFEGKAMESGWEPDTIKVKIAETGKVIEARITGTAEVRVDY